MAYLAYLVLEASYLERLEALVEASFPCQGGLEEAASYPYLEVLVVVAYPYRVDQEVLEAFPCLAEEVAFPFLTSFLEGQGEGEVPFQEGLEEVEASPSQEVLEVVVVVPCLVVQEAEVVSPLMVDLVA